MKRHYQPTGWLTIKRQIQGGKEYSYPIYCYSENRSTRTKRVPSDRVSKVRKAITARRPVKEILAIIAGEEMAIAS